MNKEVVMWPDNDEDEDDDEIWALSVDGVHCWIQEPRHPEWSQDRKCYSHKHGHAGLCYELGMSLACNKLIWMNGPFRAGKSDRSIYAEKSLKAKLIAVGFGRRKHQFTHE